MSATAGGGEFALIRDYFSQGFPRHADTRLGVGDDCSVLSTHSGLELVQSIDTQVADVHFPATAPAALIAARALRCAASDLAAMGARPQGFHLALTLPAADPAWLADFSNGLKDTAAILGLDLLGGDTTRGRELVISVSVQGWVEAGTALCRHGARPGDDVWVSDSIGAAALALPQVLQDPASFSGLARHYYYPEIQLPLGRQLIGRASACLDISDGLLQDAAHLARASGVTLALDADAIPTAVGRDDERWALCLSGGDDYQLLFTAPPQQHRALLNLSLEHSGLCCIGRVLPAGEQPVTLQSGGKPLRLPEQTGFQHF